MFLNFVCLVCAVGLCIRTATIQFNSDITNQTCCSEALPNNESVCEGRENGNENESYDVTKCIVRLMWNWFGIFTMGAIIPWWAIALNKDTEQMAAFGGVLIFIGSGVAFVFGCSQLASGYDVYCVNPSTQPMELVYKRQPFEYFIVILSVVVGGAYISSMLCEFCLMCVFPAICKPWNQALKATSRVCDLIERDVLTFDVKKDRRITTV